MTTPQASFPRWGLVGTLLWGFIIAIIYLAIQMFTFGLYIGIHHGAVSPEEARQLIPVLQYHGTVIALCTLAALMGCTPLLLGIVKIKKGARLTDHLALKPFNGKIARKWLFILAVFILLSDLFSKLVGQPVVPEFMRTAYITAQPPWLLWLAIILAAPLMEELFFRGFLFSGWCRSPLGPAGTIVVTALLWTLIHVQYDLYYLVIIFILGLGFGLARLESGSALLTIVLHAFCNLVATIETLIVISL